MPIYDLLDMGELSEDADTRRAIYEYPDPDEPAWGGPSRLREEFRERQIAQKLRGGVNLNPPDSGVNGVWERPTATAEPANVNAEKATLNNQNQQGAGSNVENSVNPQTQRGFGSVEQAIPADIRPQTYSDFFRALKSTSPLQPAGIHNLQGASPNQPLTYSLKQQLSAHPSIYQQGNFVYEKLVEKQNSMPLGAPVPVPTQPTEYLTGNMQIPPRATSIQEGHYHQANLHQNGNSQQGAFHLQAPYMQGTPNHQPNLRLQGNLHQQQAIPNRQANHFFGTPPVAQTRSPAPTTSLIPSHAEFYSRPPPRGGPPYKSTNPDYRSGRYRMISVPFPPPNNTCHYQGCNVSGFEDAVEFQ